MTPPVPPPGPEHRHGPACRDLPDPGDHPSLPQIGGLYGDRDHTTVLQLDQQGRTVGWPGTPRSPRRRNSRAQIHGPGKLLRCLFQPPNALKESLFHISPHGDFGFESRFHRFCFTPQNCKLNEVISLKFSIKTTTFRQARPVAGTLATGGVNRLLAESRSRRPTGASLFEFNRRQPGLRVPSMSRGRLGPQHFSSSFPPALRRRFPSARVRTVRDRVHGFRAEGERQVPSSSSTFAPSTRRFPALPDASGETISLGRESLLETIELVAVPPPAMTCAGADQCRCSLPKRADHGGHRSTGARRKADSRRKQFRSNLTGTFPPT